MSRSAPDVEISWLCHYHQYQQNIVSGTLEMEPIFSLQIAAANIFMSHSRLSIRQYHIKCVILRSPFIMAPPSMFISWLSNAARLRLQSAHRGYCSVRPCSTTAALRVRLLRLWSQIVWNKSVLGMHNILYYSVIFIMRPRVRACKLGIFRSFSLVFELIP